MIAFVTFILALVLSGAEAADNADSRAVELARLRREVETLSTELATRKEDLRSKLKAIDAQKTEIQVQLRREELRVAQVEGEAAVRRTQLAQHASRGGELVPSVIEAIAGLKAVVSEGLPFHLADRNAELSTLEGQLRSGTVSPEQATARLWAFAEDELRLSRENGLDRQVVVIGGEEWLADVAHLGMSALYFRTDGGVAGYARKEGAVWTWAKLQSRDESRAVETLFEKFKHGVRSGSFALPTPWRTP